MSNIHTFSSGLVVTKKYQALQQLNVTPITFCLQRLEKTQMRVEVKVTQNSKAVGHKTKAMSSKTLKHFNARGTAEFRTFEVTALKVV